MESKRGDAKSAALPKDVGDDSSVDSDGVAATDERRKKELRRAKRLAERLAQLGLDANGDPLDNFSLLTYPVREWKFKVPGVVTFICIATLWALVLWNTGKQRETVAGLDSLRTPAIKKCINLLVSYPFNSFRI